MTDLPEKLLDADREELLFSIEYAMKFERGKAKPKAAQNVAVAALARMVLDHLEMSGYVIRRRPPQSSGSVAASPGNHLKD
jgi:hypothetical protein